MTIPFHIETCKSTNDEAKALIDRGFVSPIVIYADKQTQGRGRNGKSWWSPEGMGLYASLVTQRPPDAAHDIFLTMWLGTAIVRGLRQYTLLDIHQIGVNDIYLDERKLGGILCEIYKERLIVGVGLNLYRPTKVRKDLISSACWLNEFGSEERIVIPKLLNILSEAVCRT